MRRRQPYYSAKFDLLLFFKHIIKIEIKKVILSLHHVGLDFSLHLGRSSQVTLGHTSFEHRTLRSYLNHTLRKLPRPDNRIKYIEAVLCKEFKVVYKVLSDYDRKTSHCVQPED